MEIGWWQPLQRPRRHSQLMMGMFSHARIRWPQFGQWLGGVNRDSPRGMRQTTTFKKLPMTHPKQNAIACICHNIGDKSPAVIIPV